MRGRGAFVWLRWWGIGVAALAGVLALLAWYVRGLAWRNRCGDPLPPAAVAPARGAFNSAVATSQPLATKAAAGVLAEGGSAADAAVAAALMLGVAEPGNSRAGGRRLRPRARPARRSRRRGSGCCAAIPTRAAPS
ncbi:MAG: hypothetical protein ACRENE_23510 [Polyangiaceae bacterium]